MKSQKDYKLANEIKEEKYKSNILPIIRLPSFINAPFIDFLISFLILLFSLLYFVSVASCHFLLGTWLGAV